MLSAKRRLQGAEGVHIKSNFVSDGQADVSNFRLRVRIRCSAHHGHLVDLSLVDLSHSKPSVLLWIFLIACDLLSGYVSGFRYQATDVRIAVIGLACTIP
jgi:hypothetical protein